MLRPQDITINIISVSYLPLQEASARCPNGYHKSPSGDCEKVIDTKGMPRCPNGYHRSPDGDCERVNKDSNSNGNSYTKNNDDDQNSDKSNDPLNQIFGKDNNKKIIKIN